MDDAERLLEWRNDPLTRAASHRGDPVPRDEHLRWLRHALDRDDAWLHMAEVGGVPVGVVRVEAGDDALELSWTVAPHERGKGIGRSMVVAVAATLDGPIRAQVKRDNAASIRIAEAAGMSAVREVDGVVHFLRRADC